MKKKKKKTILSFIDDKVELVQTFWAKVPFTLNFVQKLF